MTEELKEINRFTRRELSEEDVYIFSVVLCDNEIDRDYERFSDEALETLAKMFVGVTGIADHEPKSSNQSARIFSCRVEAPQGQLTSDGKAYRRLCARAYLPRSEKTQECGLCRQAAYLLDLRRGYRTLSAPKGAGIRRPFVLCHTA